MPDPADRRVALGMVFLPKDRGQHVGLDSDLMASVGKRVGLPPPHLDVTDADLRPPLSHVRRRLEEVFGEEIAQRSMVAGTRSHRFGDGQYGLAGLAPPEIVIV